MRMFARQGIGVAGHGLKGISLTGLLLSGVVAFGAAPALAQSADSASSACKPTDGPVELSYWSWGAGYADATSLWNSLHPEIQVVYSDIPVSNSGGYQKMFNAVKAGTAPDIGFLEFDNIAAFGSQGYLADIAPYFTDEEKADFLDPVKVLAALGVEGAMYSTPIGGGPMALIYRKDLFDAAGIALPRTWAELEVAAAKVREVDAGATLINFDGYGHANWFAGLSSQHGAQWFGVDGNDWRISVNDAATKETAELWQRMLDSGAASDLSTFSPAWSSALAEGRIWSWPTAVWGAGVIKGAAPATAGNWAVAPLPVWNEADKVSAIWGGGGLSVFNTSAHPCEAARFSLWMATDPEALKIMNAAVGIYPTTKSLLADPIFTQPDEFFGGQKIFDVFLEASAQTPDFTWGPSMTDTYKSITDAFSLAKANGTSLAASLDDAQAAVVSSMEKDGFTVKQ
ncbi:MAG: sugar ABC transporter substrate-binding protein [Devosia sp.]|nr:sugar ABC transporter substrate-binding protein [Devosia sp.]